MEPKSRSSRIAPAATRSGSAGATVRTVHVVTHFVGAACRKSSLVPKWSSGSTFDGSEPGGSAIYVVRPDGRELRKAGRRRRSAVVPRWRMDLLLPQQAAANSIALPAMAAIRRQSAGLRRDGYQKNHRIVSGSTIPGTLWSQRPTCEERLRAAAKRPMCYRSRSQEGTLSLRRPESGT